MPVNILNMVDYTVTAVDYTEHDYHIKAETKITPSNCPYCQSKNLVGFGRREQLVKDMPMHGRRVGLYVSTRRIKCQACHKTFSEPLPEVDDKRAMTKRLLEWIGKQAIKRTFTSIAEEVGITEGAVRIILNDYISELEKTVKVETPTWMGIDEIHLIKPRGVITNISQIDALAKKLKEKLLEKDSAIAKSYLNLLVDKIVINDKKAVVTGSYSVILQTATFEEGNISNSNQVPTFMPDWRPHGDSGFDANKSEPLVLARVPAMLKRESCKNQYHQSVPLLK